MGARQIKVQKRRIGMAEMEQTIGAWRKTEDGNHETTRPVCWVKRPVCGNLDRASNRKDATMPATTVDTHDDIARGLDHLAQADARLVPVIETAGAVPLRRSAPGFASLAQIIIAQQVSRQSADAITARLTRLIDPLTPDAFVAAGEPAWVEAGLSRPKQRALVAACEAIADGKLDLHALCDHPAERAIGAMTQVKGIGPWTAEVYLLFAAGHGDIFPAGDLALRAAAADALGLEQRPDEKSLRQTAESWAPWRGVAARLLWAYYAATAGRSVMP